MLSKEINCLTKCMRKGRAVTWKKRMKSAKQNRSIYPMLAESKKRKPRKLKRAAQLRYHGAKGRRKCRKENKKSDEREKKLTSGGSWAAK